MANKVEYTSEKILDEFVEMVWQQTDFAKLREEDVTVLACFCTRTRKDGEPADAANPPVKLKKVDEAFRVFMPKMPHYVLIVDYTFWTEAQPQTQEMLINRALCAIEVGRTEEGELKVKKKPPEFSGYYKNVVRYPDGDASYRELFERMASVRSLGFRENVHRLLPQEPAAATPPEATEPEATQPEPKAKPVSTKIKPPTRGPLPELKPDEADGEQPSE
jgi:Putative phage metallopeptidase